MHNLSEFMKGFMQRYTQWHNRTHERTGRLWEDRFKSVIVEDGVAAKTIAAYIDLNPVRAGIVKNPEEYRWSSYGEAIGGGALGNGKKARAGLGEKVEARLEKNGEMEKLRKRLRKQTGISSKEIAMEVQKLRDEEEKRMGEIPFGRMLRCRVRYFTDGAVIGSRGFVDEVFASARDRFGAKRKDGARKMRGEAGAAAAGILWSLRDLQK